MVQEGNEERKAGKISVPGIAEAENPGQNKDTRERKLVRD